MKRLTVFFSILSIGIPMISHGYPNGTPFYVTDMAPFCASCHSVAKSQYMPELPKEFANREMAENKHYAFIRSPFPPSPYLELTEEQKAKIIKEAKQIDANSSVSIMAPSRVKAGEELKVVIKVKGGNGPAIGVMLVDKPLRFQARPITSNGWIIIGEPEVRGQGGHVQKTWLERRIMGLKRNLNYIMITDQKFDIEKLLFPSGEITFTLKAPERRGIYSLTAAFLYGTENTDKAGFFQRPSGRILFSQERKVQVE